MDAAADLPLPCRELTALAEAVGRVAGVDEARRRAADIVAFVAGQLGSGLGGFHLARLIAALNDRLVCRVIALTARRHRLPQVPWCWLALGSEGRCEQTFVTDQDNGLIFSAADATEAEALRRLFLPFAHEVNGALAECGFALCRGEVMAGNPKWCLSLDEWEMQFIEWVRRPEPMALMHATIFFDLRPLYGDVSLGERLRDLLLRLTGDTPAFLHLMAANALQSQPPLGLLGEVVSEDGERGGVDLKKYGARIFVDAARIFALASGVRPVETRLRLQEAGRKCGLLDHEVAAAQAALSHLLRLRLAAQATALAAGEVPDHGVRPGSLHDVDRAILKESLRQAKRVQQRLKLNYAL
mgnify:CR=1 FL=1